MKIVIAAKIDAGAGQEYYDTYCKDLMTNHLVEYRGEVDDAGKIDIFTNALVNLHPLFSMNHLA